MTPPLVFVDHETWRKFWRLRPKAKRLGPAHMQALKRWVCTRHKAGHKGPYLVVTG